MNIYKMFQRIAPKKNRNLSHYFNIDAFDNSDTLLSQMPWPWCQIIHNIQKCKFSTGHSLLHYILGILFYTCFVEFYTGGGGGGGGVERARLWVERCASGVEDWGEMGGGLKNYVSKQASMSRIIRVY